MTFTDNVNAWVSYFKDEYIDGDNNVFKIPMDDDESEEQLDEKQLDEIVSCVWSKNNYLYVELNASELEEQYKAKMKEWEEWKEDENREYWESRW